MLAHALGVAHQRRLAAGLVGDLLRLEKGVQRTLGVHHQHPAAGQAHGDVGTAAALVGIHRDLLVEIEAVLQARRLQHIAQGLLAPPALHARAAAQGRRQLARLELGVGRGLEQFGDLLLEPALILGAGLFHGGDLQLELGQGLRHRLELAGHALQRQGLLRAEGLAGALHQLIGHDLGRLRRLGLEDFAILARLPQPLLGHRQAPRQGRGAHKGEHGQDQEQRGQAGGGQESWIVHDPFASMTRGAGEESRRLSKRSDLK
jgi:hypothetical protein